MTNWGFGGKIRAKVGKIMDKFESNKNMINRIDITKEYYKIFDMVREKFTSMVQNQDYSVFSRAANQYKLDINDLLDQNFFSYENLENYLVLDEEGKITIADEHYSFPPFMFEIVHVLTKMAILNRIQVNFDKYYVNNKSLKAKEEDKYQTFLEFKLAYHRKLAKERKSHTEVTKVIANPRTSSRDCTSYEREDFTLPINSLEEYISTVISSSMLIAWLDYQRSNSLKDFETGGKLFN